MGHAAMPDPEEVLRDEHFESYELKHSLRRLREASRRGDETPVFCRASKLRMEATFAYVPHSDVVWVAYRDIDLSRFGFRDVTQEILPH